MPRHVLYFRGLLELCERIDQRMTRTGQNRPEQSDIADPAVHFGVGLSTC
jgi:hypothetical protein